MKLSLGLKDFLLLLWKNLSRHDIFTLSAALSFYTALSLAPILVIIVFVIGSLGIRAQSNLIFQAKEIMGPQASQMIEIIVNNINLESRMNSFAGFIALCLLLFSASGAFVQLQFSINTIWDAKPLSSAQAEVKSWLKKRLVSAFFVLLCAFLILVSIAASAAINMVFEGAHHLLKEVNFFLTFFVFTYLFRTIFRYLPDDKDSKSYTWYGGLLTALLFTLGKDLIGSYLGSKAISSAYGTAGSFVVFLLWIYFSSLIVFVGAEFTRTLQLKNLK